MNPRIFAATALACALLAGAVVALHASAQPAAYTAYAPTGERYTVNGIQADDGAPLSITTATTTVVITGKANRRTYITHDAWASNGAGTVQWVYGTGSLCGTGQGALTGAYDVTAQFGISEGIGLGPIHKPTPVGNDTCIITTGSATVKGDVAFSQQP